MSDFFDKFIRMFEAVGPSPVQYGRNGVMKSESKEVEKAVALSVKETKLISGFSAASHDSQICPDCSSAIWKCGCNVAQEKKSDGRLDAVVGRVSAANRVIQRMSFTCPQGADCLRIAHYEECRLWKCDHCDFEGCALCVDAHEKAGHVTDLDQAREMERSR